MPESIHQAARQHNLCRLAPGLRNGGAPGAGKVSVHAGGARGHRQAAAARRPRQCYTTVAYAPRRTRCAQRFDSHQRRSGLARTRRASLVAWPWMPRPVFRLVGRENSRPGSVKPAKAEPMKDEIRFWKRNPVKTFPMKDGIGVFWLWGILYTKPLAKASGGCAQTIQWHQHRVYGCGADRQGAFDLKAHRPVATFRDGECLDVHLAGNVAGRQFVPVRRASPGRRGEWPPGRQGVRGAAGPVGDTC